MKLKPQDDCVAETISIHIDRFMELAEKYPVYDARTPDEFQRGHIPGAINLPLFSDEERAQIGTTYVRKGRDTAILEGLDVVGPKMRRLVESVRETASGNTILLHCWRGGMRSGSLAWLLCFCGFSVYLLEGGYKAFRQYVLAAFEMPRWTLILSGATGAGKTEILQNLAASGEQVIDLEKCACHKGSSFGRLGEPDPPSQQHFENILGVQWRKSNPEIPLWLEDESQKIGTRIIPRALWRQIRNSPVIYVKMDARLRTERLLKDYGDFSRTELREATERLKRRLGGLQTQAALNAIAEDNLKKCVEILLSQYYDKTYLFGLSKRDPLLIHPLETNTPDATENARQVLRFSRTLSERLQIQTAG